MQQYYIVFRHLKVCEMWLARVGCNTPLDMIRSWTPLSFSLFFSYISTSFFYSFTISRCSLLAVRDQNTKERISSGFPSASLWLEKTKVERDTLQFSTIRNPWILCFYFCFSVRVFVRTQTADYKICKFLFSTKRNHFWKFVCQATFARPLRRPPARKTAKKC